MHVVSCSQTASTLQDCKSSSSSQAGGSAIKTHLSAACLVLASLLDMAISLYAHPGPIFLGTLREPSQLKQPGPQPTMKQVKEACVGDGWPRGGNSEHKWRA